MRTRTAAENTILGAAVKNNYLKAETKDFGGAWVELTNLSGFNWVKGCSWGEEVDQPVAEARVRLRRDNGSGLSLSPTRTDSSLNVGGPLLDPGRELKISTATTAAGVAPIAGDWKLKFHGVIDLVNWASAEVELIGRDLGSRLNDGWIEAEKVYAEGTNTAIETVMQSILTDSGGGVLLYTPTAPGFVVTAYRQQQQSVMDALTALANLIGWVVGYKWDDGTSTFRLTFREPDRTKTVPDWTFAANRYFDVRQLKIDRTTIRNVVTVSYFDSVLAKRTSVTATEATSVARFERQWMEIEEADDSPINTSAEATSLANDAVSDLALPYAEQAIDTQYFWPGEVGDLDRFSANAVHYNADQDLAVVALRHEFGEQLERTTVVVRGKPVGFYLGWHARATTSASDEESKLARLVREIPINLFHPSYARGEAPWQNAIASIGEYSGYGSERTFSASAEVTPGADGSAYRMRLRFKDSAGNILGTTYTSGVFTAAVGAESGVLKIEGAVRPEGGVEAELILEHVSGPVGAPYLKLPQIVPGDVAKNYTPTPTMEGMRFDAGFAVGVAASSIVEWLQQSGVSVGVPLEAVSTASVYDNAGLLQLFDTALRKILNTQLDRVTVTINDAIGVLREIENIRNAAVKDAEAIGVLATGFLEWEARQRSLIGVPGAGVGANDIYDAAGLLKVYDSLARHFNNVVRIDGSGQIILLGMANMDDGIAPRAIVKGYLSGKCEGGSVSGSSWVDGAAVVFPVLFQGVPVISLYGGAATEPRRSKWTGNYSTFHPVRKEFSAINPTAGGFTPRCRLLQIGGTFTARTDTFGANTLDAVGESAAVELANAPGHNDRYTIRVSYDLACSEFTIIDGAGYSVVVPGSALIEWKVDSSSDGGSTWVTRATGIASISGPDETLTSHKDHDVTVTGLSASAPADEFRVVVTNIETQNGSAEISAVTVKYDTNPDTPVSASMTPDQATDAQDRMDYTVFSVN